MLELPVRHLITSLAIPSIISMLCTSFYNMADTFFVSKIDTAATAAVGVTFASMAIMQALAFFFGMGSGNAVSRLLGAGKRDAAHGMISTSFFYAFCCGLVVALGGNFFVSDIAVLTGSTPTILPYAIQYLSVILWGAPVMMCSLLMNNHLRFQGSSSLGMIGIMAGGFLNVLLDPLFIFYFHQGVAGAAYATVLSQIVSFCILFCMTRRGGNIPFRLRAVHPSWPVFKEIVAGGAPSLTRQGTTSVATICLNVAAGAYGDAAIAAMSIVTRLSFFAAAVIIGFGQGFSFAVTFGTTFACVVSVVAFLFASSIIALFRDDPAVISIGIWALRCQCVTFPFTALVVITNMTLQTTRHTLGAMVVAAGRSGIFLIPAFLLLPYFFGLAGLVWCQSLSDILAFILAFFLIRLFFKEIPKTDMVLQKTVTEPQLAAGRK